MKGGHGSGKEKFLPIRQSPESGPVLFEDHLDIMEYFLGQTAGQRQSLVD